MIRFSIGKPFSNRLMRQAVDYISAKLMREELRKGDVDIGVHRGLKMGVPLYQG